MDFSQQVLFHETPITILYFLIGWAMNASDSAVLLISLIGLVRPRHRRRFAASVGILSWIMLVAALFYCLAYLWEIAVVYNNTNPYEKFSFFHPRWWGDYAWIYWSKLAAIAVVPQLFWFHRCRTNLWWSFSISLLVFLGLSFERIVLFITALSQDFLPESWYH